MPLVDTVISVAKASRFGLLQHPITLISQMATSATDRKATGADITGALKIAQTGERLLFNNRDRYSLTWPSFGRLPR
jgi:hypothetical protein